MENKNLRLYLQEEDYKVWSGSGWPTYEEFLNGKSLPDADTQQIAKEMLNYVFKEGIKFPIRTATSCQSKWTWSTIYLNQLATASCHRVQPIKFKLEDFDNFHNIPKKINDRQLMLKGEWPTGGCEYCKNIEDAGGHSDRQHNLEIRDLTPPELETDFTATTVTPRIVEIFAQNTCNLMCTYCHDSLSSKIQQENIKFGPFNKNGVSIIPSPIIAEASEEYFIKFLNWLEKNIKHLKRLHLLGGETFIQHRLMNGVLSIIENNPAPDLQLCIFSNLNAPDKFFFDYLNRIKVLQKDGHIKVFDLTASIDCWGAEAEYARFGLDLQKFEENFKWASEQDDWMRLNANQTVTALTMKTMPDLIEKIAKYSKNKHIGHYFQFSTGSHPYLHPQTFSYTLWRETFEKIFSIMPNTTSHQQEAIVRMQGLQAQLKLKTEHNFDAIQKLHIYLDELDRRRGSNWREIFPYLIV